MFSSSASLVIEGTVTLGSADASAINVDNATTFSISGASGTTPTLILNANNGAGNGIKLNDEIDLTIEDIQITSTSHYSGIYFDAGGSVAIHNSNVAITANDKGIHNYSSLVPLGISIDNSNVTITSPQNGISAENYAAQIDITNNSNVTINSAWDGIYVDDATSSYLNVDNSELLINVSDATYDGIKFANGGDVTFDNNASVSITAPTYGIDSSNFYMNSGTLFASAGQMGVYGASINITGGTVNAKSANGTGLAAALCDISGSANVTAEGGAAGIDGLEISISGGTVIAKGNGSSSGGIATESPGTISITGGDVTAIGAATAIICSATLTTTLTIKGDMSTSGVCNTDGIIAEITGGATNVGDCTTFPAATTSFTLDDTFKSVHFYDAGNPQPYVPVNDTSSRSSSSSGGGYSGGSAYVEPTVWTDKGTTGINKMTVTTDAAGNKVGKTSSTAKHGVRVDALKPLAKGKYSHSTIVDRKVVAVLTVYDASLIKKDILDSAWVAGKDVDYTRARFAKYYTNKLGIVKLDQVGDFGTTIRVTAKITNLKDIGKPAYVYNYNPKTGKYSLIKNANLSVDSKGYVSFNTTAGGYIIVTSEPLAKKAK